MAIAQCPECAGAVSTHAAFCPHCGRPGADCNPVSVAIRDAQMGFGSMVVFLVKLAIAAIPALIILFLIGAFAAGILFGLAGIGTKH
jgi:hypothetical protein